MMNNNKSNSCVVQNSKVLHINNKNNENESQLASEIRFGQQNNNNKQDQTQDNDSSSLTIKKSHSRMQNNENKNNDDHDDFCYNNNNDDSEEKTFTPNNVQVGPSSSSVSSSCKKNDQDDPLETLSPSFSSKSLSPSLHFPGNNTFLFREHIQHSNDNLDLHFLLQQFPNNNNNNNSNNNNNNNNTTIELLLSTVVTQLEKLHRVFIQQHLPIAQSFIPFFQQNFRHLRSVVWKCAPSPSQFRAGRLECLSKALAKCAAGSSQITIDDSSRCADQMIAYQLPFLQQQQPKIKLLTRNDVKQSKSTKTEGTATSTSTSSNKINNVIPDKKNESKINSSSSSSPSSSESTSPLRPFWHPDFILTEHGIVDLSLLQKGTHYGSVFFNRDQEQFSKSYFYLRKSVDETVTKIKNVLLSNSNNDDDDDSQQYDDDVVDFIRDKITTSQSKHAKANRKHYLNFFATLESTLFQLQSLNATDDKFDEVLRKNNPFQDQHHLNEHRLFHQFVVDEISKARKDRNGENILLQERVAAACFSLYTKIDSWAHSS